MPEIVDESSGEQLSVASASIAGTSQVTDVRPARPNPIHSFGPRPDIIAEQVLTAKVTVVAAARSLKLALEISRSQTMVEAVGRPS